MSQPKPQLKTRVEKLEEQVKLLLSEVNLLKDKNSKEKENYEEQEKTLKLDEELRQKLEMERLKLVDELREARERELKLEQERDKERETRLKLEVELKQQREHALKIEQERLKLKESCQRLELKLLKAEEETVKLERQCEEAKRQCGIDYRFERIESAMVDMLVRISQSLKCMNILNSSGKREKKLTFSVKSGNVEAAQLLVNSGTNVVAGDSLHWAVKSGNLEICELLLESGVQINARALDNCTPLHVAALRGDVIMVKLLLKWKADVSMRHYELKPSELARQAGHNMVAEYLAEIESGIRPLPT